VNLGSSLSETGRIAEAVAMYQRAVAIKPNYMAYTNLGTAYSRANRHQEAASAYKKALALNDKDSMVWGNLAFVYSWMNGMNEQTRETFSRAIQLAEAKRAQSPRDPYIHGDLALYYAKLGRTEVALERLNTALALAPKGPDTQATAAEVHELIGQRERALAFAKKSIELGYSRQRLQRNPELSAVMQSLQSN
jgi:tetratricopeptide (TPR) repeat protein